MTTLLTLLATFALVAPAPAVTEYEIEGEWTEGTPEQIATDDTVSARWWISLNDDAAAPGNEPVENVLVTLAAANAAFDNIPPACLTDGVTPPSSISDDGTTLECNLGEHVEGSALTLVTGMRATGAHGDEVSVTAAIGEELSVGLLPLTVENEFLQDIMWEQNAGSTTAEGGARLVSFNWTLFHGAHSPAGPDSVTYELTLANSHGAAMQVGSEACAPFTRGAAIGHPWSGGDHGDGRLAPFVEDCELTHLGGNSFQLTLSGIDYSHDIVPTTDSSGRSMPTDRVAVASGTVQFRILTTEATGNAEISANAPVYEAVDGSQVRDDEGNNTSALTWLTGFHNGGWHPSFSGSSDSQWADTYRVAPGTLVSSVVSANYRNVTNLVAPVGGYCTILDTEHVTYAGHVVEDVNFGNAELDLPVQFYTGSIANPNSFENCGSEAGWTSTLPDDLSTISAVRVTFDTESDIDRQSRPALRVRQQISEDVPIGQDVWVWSGYRANNANATWNYPNRDTEPGAQPPSHGTTTPGSRYPYAANHRDVLRIVGVRPAVDKSVNPSTVEPGGTATYTLEYSADGSGDVAETVDDYQLVDTLPVGASYVAGSATPEPSVSGRTLTWELDGVATNETHTLSYEVEYDSDLPGGDQLINSVTASVQGLTGGDTATVTVNDAGFTQIAKTADQAYIPNVDGDGVGEGAWTVTVRSQDPTTQDFTDVIDILPYVGDERGTSYSGDYVLTGVEAVDGATVYYTTTDPAVLSDDPADSSNGQAGDVADNTVGWTTDFTPEATAVRVIGPELPAGESHQFTIGILTDGAEAGDVFVNRAQGRAENTRLVMRTSEPTEVANYYSASLKKYVQGADGEWHDANEPEDYPTFRIGDEVTYRVVVENTGGGTLTNIVVADDQQPELGAFTIESLAPGDTDSHEYTVTLDESFGGSLVNTASATPDTPPDVEEPPNIPPDPAGIDVVNYTVAKFSDPESGTAVAPGDTVTYTVTVEQEGTVPAEAWFRDSLADVLDDATYNGDVAASIGTAEIEDGVLSWEGTVPVGETASITYSVTVDDAADLDDGTLANVVFSPGCEGECTTEHPTGWFTFAKDSLPEPGSDVQVGDVVTYMVTVTQEGTGVVEGASVVDDLSGVLDGAAYNGDASATSGEVTVDGETLAWSGDLAVDDVVTITYTVTVTGEGDGELANVVSSDDPRGDCEDCTTEHQYGWFTFAKDSLPAPGSDVQVGDTVDYTVTVTQEGPGAVTDVSVVDDLSQVFDDATYNDDVAATSGEVTVDGETLSWSGDLAVGEVVEITYSVTVTGGGDGQLANVVTTDDPRGDCEDCTTEHQYGWFGYAKDSVPEPGADIQPGDTVEYTVTITQDGQAAVEDASITDDLSQVFDDATYNEDATASAGEVTIEGNTLTWSGDLAVDEVVEITYSVTFTGGGDDVLYNVVTTDDPRGECLEGTCRTQHPSGWFTVAKDSVPAPGSDVQIGDTIQYTVSVTPHGSAPVLGATLTDDLSAVLANAAYNDDATATVGEVIVDGETLAWAGDLTVDEVVEVTYSVTVTDEGTLANAVTTEDPRGECEECETEHQAGSYSYAKDSLPAPGTTVQVGDTVEYTVTVTQSGPGGVAEASVVDDLSEVLDDATYNEDVTATSGEVAVEDGVLSWSGDLTVGQVVEITYSVTVTGGGDGDLTNVVSSDDPRPDCEGVCETGHQYGWFGFAKDSLPAPGSDVQVGDVVTYMVTVAQDGPGAVDGASVVDDLSAVLDGAVYNDDASATSGAVAVDGETLSWSGDLGVDETVTITYTVTVTGDGDGTLRNVISSDDPRGDCGGECTTEHQYGWFGFAKASDREPGAEVQPGEVVNYTVTVAHAGEGVVEDAAVTDDLSQVLDDATYNGDATATAGEVVIEGDLLSWSGDLAVGQVVEITYSVTFTGGGDDVLYNVVTTDDPRGECLDGTCRVQHPSGWFTVAKDSVPAPGSDVQIGDTVQYTLSVTAHGSAPVLGATLTDDLSGVLDDATYNEDVTASAGEVVLDGDTLAWSGDLAMGQVVEITYSVTFTGGGDDVLYNVVTTDDPRGECEGLCVVQHPGGGFTFAKEAVPGPGGDVEVGDTVEYTLTVAHRGDGSVLGAAITDDLSEVLDDATYNDDVTASSGEVVVANGALAWTGDLAVDDIVTITYSVTVTGGGDGVLTNVVTTDHPGGECADRCETEHRVPPLPPEPPAPAGPPHDLPTTGAPVAGLVGTALAMIVFGVVMVGSHRGRAGRRG